MRLSAFAGIVSRFSPWYIAVPLARPLRASRPSIASTLWLLPEPDSPTMPSVLPSSSSKLTPLTARTVASGVWNATSRSFTLSSDMARHRSFGSSASRSPSPTKLMQ